MLEPPWLYIVVKAVIDFISESKFVTLTKVGLNFKGELQFWALVSCKWGSSPEPLNSKSNALPLGDYTPDYCCKVIRQTCQCNKYSLKPHFYSKTLVYRGIHIFYIYIFIAITLDESILLYILHFPMKNIKSRDLEATPMGGATTKPVTLFAYRHDVKHENLNLAVPKLCYRVSQI